MKKIEKIKKIYLKHKVKTSNCLTILDEKFAYGRGREPAHEKSKAARQLMKRMKNLFVSRGRYRNKKEKEKNLGNELCVCVCVCIYILY